MRAAVVRAAVLVAGRAVVVCVTSGGNAPVRPSLPGQPAAMRSATPRAVAAAALLAALLAGTTACSSQAGDSNPDSESEQVPLPTGTPSP